LPQIFRILFKNDRNALIPREYAKRRSAMAARRHGRQRTSINVDDAAVSGAGAVR
jgi:hypothetical protein